MPFNPKILHGLGLSYFHTSPNMWYLDGSILHKYMTVPYFTIPMVRRCTYGHVGFLVSSVGLGFRAQGSFTRSKVEGSQVHY